MMISKGTPFMLAGEEMLRTKDGDGNSYMSSDAINNIDWDALKADSDEYRMARFYADLIALREECGFFSDCDVTCKILDGFVIEATYRVHGNIKAMAIINPNEEAFSYTLPSGDWKVLLENEQFLHRETVASGTRSVAGKTVLLVDR